MFLPRDASVISSFCYRIMKVIIQNLQRVGLLWLICIAPAEAISAQNFSPDNSPKVAIIESCWYERLPELVYSRRVFSGDDVSRPYFYNSLNKTLDCYSFGLSNTCSVARGREKQFVYQIKVRNAGEKQIVALDWEYIFINPETEKVVERRSFHTQARIRPGKSGTLSEISVSPPTRVINVRMLEKSPENQVAGRIVINSVIFLDGSVWIRSGQDD